MVKIYVPDLNLRFFQKSMAACVFLIKKMVLTIMIMSLLFLSRSSLADCCTPYHITVCGDPVVGEHCTCIPDEVGCIRFTWFGEGCCVIVDLSSNCTYSYSKNADCTGPSIENLPCP